ncbi:MAG TPA: hypothetical protein VG346_09045 [Acidimicrobiales bacterium]|nr:hypothetical protein [Acidimicrobiales bacterium]
MVEGIRTTEGRGPRLARGRPNWWVILAVSLALMALLVATAGTPTRTPRGTPALANDAPHGAGPGVAAGSTTTTTPPTRARTPPTSLLSARGGGTGAGGGVGTPTTVAPATTVPTTPVPTTTTTTAGASASASQPSDRMQSQGVIEPPQQRSSSVGFTGAGATEVSVVWSGSTYLTMEVSCPNGSQSVGGSSAMAASLPDASGSCLATVSEPSSESTALTYTITIGPAGG